MVLLYLPQYLRPHIFPPATFAFRGRAFQLPIWFLAYSGLLAGLEIFFLTLQNIYFIHKTGIVTGFLHKGNKNDAAVKAMVLGIANSKTTKADAKYGINPFLGLSRRTVLTIVLLQKAKGMLSNAIVKAAAGRLGGRFALQIVQNMLGIPVYAFWDAWATRAVLRRARAVIMGQNLIRHLFAQLPPVTDTSAGFKALLFDSLQYVATSKRYYHDNHNLLTGQLFERYGLDPQCQDASPQDFIARLKAAPAAQRSICARVMLTGFLLDERLTAREELHVHALKKAGLLPYDFGAVAAAHRRFMAGRPVLGFIAAA